jgi:ABC-type branched-subunit amino acid transport system substrate-binding protein
MWEKRSALAAAGLAMGLLLAACASSGSSASSGGGSSSSSGSIPIGAEADLTGQFAPFGAGLEQGLQAGEHEVNAAGGPLGRQLKLVSGDSASDPVDAVPVASRLVQVDHVVAEVGISGAEAQAVVPTFTGAKVPVLTPGGDTFFDTNTNPMVWRLTPSDSQLGVGMALYGRYAGYSKAAVMMTTGGVAQGLKPVVLGSFVHDGGTIVSTQNLQPDLTSYQSEIAAIIKAHPQVIFSEMDPPTAAVVFKEFHAAGVSIPIIGTDDMIGASMVKAVGASTLRKVMVNVEGGLFTSPATKVFSNAIAAVSKSTAQPNSSYGYDGVIITALAIEEAGKADSVSINNAIPMVTRPGGTIVYSFAQGLKLLKEKKRITYVGASGPFSYNAHHNVYGPFIAVKVNTAGVYQTIYTMTPAQLAKATP